MTTSSPSLRKKRKSILRSRLIGLSNQILLRSKKNLRTFPFLPDFFRYFLWFWYFSFWINDISSFRFYKIFSFQCFEFMHFHFLTFRNFDTIFMKIFPFDIDEKVGNHANSRDIYMLILCEFLRILCANSCEFHVNFCEFHASSSC